MRRPDSRYLVLWLFLFGTVIVLLLQVISGYNINRLISGNRTLLNELRVQNDLRRLERDLLIAESDLRRAIITDDKNGIADIQKNNLVAEQELKELQFDMASKRSEDQINLLQRLLIRKRNLNQQILTAFEHSGKAGAEYVVNNNHGKGIRDSIIAVINQIEGNRQIKLKSTVDSIEVTGSRARLWGFVITGMALVALITAFLFVINKGRQQQRMIAALNASEKKSKDLANMQEQFLANMSHEIRTPMNSILGFTNLLKRTQLNPMQREYIQNIHSSGENLLTLVNDILDLSKIESGMMQLEETRFSLRSMISSVGAMFIEKIKERDLKFDVYIDKEVPDILSGDAVRLTQILVNLISNAVKFTDKGGISIHVQLLSALENNVRIRICVKDTGIGIPHEKQAAVFERFQQAEAATTRRFGGTGLGLSIVRQLVDLLGGEITLKSDVGEGTEFRVELPYKLPDLAQMYSEALAEQEEQVPLQKIKVLIAEDNLMNQQLIKHLMKSWSLDHNIVSTGAEAIETLKKNDYSIVLMDIQMPEMDGYTATSVIRNELKSDVPIIAMTAHAMIGEKEKCLQLGMNDYVSKPIKETVLYNIIARHAQHIPENLSTTNENIPGSKAINLNYLHQLSGNDKNFENEILKQFSTQAPEELSQLKNCIDQNNFDGVRRWAHTLKSTVGYIGLADELHPYLEQIEKDSIVRNSESFSSNYLLVKAKCDLALKEVKTLLDKGLV